MVSWAAGWCQHWPRKGPKSARWCGQDLHLKNTPQAALRKPGSILREGDITDLAGISSLIARFEIDTVFHLAAININTGAGVSPYQVFETNIRGVYTVLEACRTAAKPVSAIISSSKEVEDCFLPGSTRAHHPYMVSKAAAELTARAYHDTFGVPLALVRSDNLVRRRRFQLEPAHSWNHSSGFAR